MLYLQFFVGFLTYSCLAFASYSEFLKNHPLYYYLGISLAILANLSWLSIARAESNSSLLMIKGLWWDSMLTIVYLTVPILFFQARFSLVQSIGIGLTVLGLFVIKLG